MTQSTMPSTPGAVVTPQWGNWQQPPWPSTGVPPGCFSELARLNQCYNEVQMMEMILSKVVCDLATNNVAFQTCLVEAIAKSGSNVPLIGVTNGSDAQPGQVGEWYLQSQNLPITGVLGQTIPVSFTMQPGDWDIWAETNNSVWVSSQQFSLNPIPVGMSDNMTTIIAVPGQPEAVTVVSTTSRGLFSVPTLLVFQAIVNNVGTPGSAGDMVFTLKARRAR